MGEEEVSAKATVEVQKTKERVGAANRKLVRPMLVDSDVQTMMSMNNRGPPKERYAGKEKVVAKMTLALMENKGGIKLRGLFLLIRNPKVIRNLKPRTHKMNRTNRWN